MGSGHCFAQMRLQVYLVVGVRNLKNCTPDMKERNVAEGPLKKLLWVISSKAASLSTSGKVLFWMPSKGSVLFEQEGISVVAYLCWQVMEQCVARLDVAMFNAILRESDNEIPTDPVSDPVVDSKVLPIPAGDLSFGSGAQLKNSIGNWSRWLADMFGMDADNFAKERTNCEDDDRRGGDVESKSFPLMNSLSDLLMLPKDMLIDRSIRKEVCPSLGLPLIKRILCNFTPDEFCPDPVPGAVLEALNSESWLERRKSEGDSISSFPCSAAPIVYSPPLLADVAEKVADAGGQAELGRNTSMVQRRGYTSDDDLDELESPLTSIIDKLPPSPPIANGNGKLKETVRSNGEGVRYQLLREVWSV